MSSSSSDAAETLRFLWSSAHLHAQDAPSLTRVLLLELHAFAAAEGLTLPPQMAQRFCGSCFSLLTPGVDCSVKRVTHPRRPASRRQAIRVRCQGCGHVAEFVAAPKPPARSVAGADDNPASTAAAAATKKRGGEAARAPGKRARKADQGGAGQESKPGKGARAAPAPRRPRRAAASTSRALAGDGSAGSGLFGFDFVPLTQ